jgi:hypothetical protein
MGAPSFLDLKDYARERTATENNNSVTDSFLGKAMNFSLGAFYSLITTTYEDYNLTRYLATINTGNTIPLAPNFSKLRAVDFGSPGQWTTVFGYNLQERNRNNNPIANMVVPFGNLAARRVRVMGNQLYVEPEQLASGQYQVWYTPKYTWLTDDQQTVGPEMDIDGMVEYAVAATAIKIYNRLNLPSTGLIDEMKYYGDLAIESLSSRMNNGPEVVANVTNISDWGFPLGLAGTGLG